MRPPGLPIGCNMNQKEWEDIAAKLLVGRKIVSVHYMSDREMKTLDWDRRAVVIQLDHGLLIFPSADDEGTDAGALFTTDDKSSVLPVLGQ